MDKNKVLLDEYSKYMLPVLPFKNIVVSYGKGSYVWDMNGDKYLDLNSGQFCAIFGHSNDGVATKLNHIAHKIQNTDTSSLSEDVLLAAKKVHDITPEMNSRLIFLSTGAEANECCLRYAKHIKEKSGIVAFDIGYHGLSHGTAAYSMSRSRIRPILEHSYVVTAPKTYNEGQLQDSEIDEYVDEFEKVISGNIENIAAAIFEPIISGGGLYFPPKYYFKKIRDICNKYDIFLIFDECQTGFGRTGTWFYYQQLGCVPDFIVCAKAIGLGFPVACVIANGNVITHDIFAMQHYSSHQNEPFAASIVAHGIDTIKTECLMRKNNETGKYLLSSLVRLSQRYDTIVDPRGVGLMAGFNLFCKGVSNYKEFGEKFCNMALENGIVLQHCNNGKTIRLLPNYYTNNEEIDYLLQKLVMVFDKFK